MLDGADAPFEPFSCLLSKSIGGEAGNESTAIRDIPSLGAVTRFRKDDNKGHRTIAKPLVVLQGTAKNWPHGRSAGPLRRRNF